MSTVSVVITLGQTSDGLGRCDDDVMFTSPQRFIADIGGLDNIRIDRCGDFR